MSPSDIDSHTYNAANRWDGSSTGWAYDANGNETSAVVSGGKDRTQTVNAKDQYTGFTVAGSTYAMQYAGAGQDERTQSGTTAFTTSPTGQVRGNNNGSIADYVRDPGGTLIAMRYSSASYYYLFDGLGSVVGLSAPPAARPTGTATTPTASAWARPKASRTTSSTPAGTSTAAPACTRSASATTTPPSAASPNDHVRVGPAQLEHALLKVPAGQRRDGGAGSLGPVSDTPYTRGSAMTCSTCAWDGNRSWYTPAGAAASVNRSCMASANWGTDSACLTSTVFPSTRLGATKRATR
jgi:hypothetical protein